MDKNDDCSKPFDPKLHVEAMQSIMPSKQTDPRISHKIRVPHTIASKTLILQRCFHVILSYEKSSDEDCSGWLMAGFIKESLGRALSGNPIFAGRFRPFDDDGDLEVVSNDSGVRMIEARVDARLIDFLENIKCRREDEAELVFWEDVDEQNPQYSPLFYVQVTNFSCGGYSIGISCSLLLADPFTLTTFVKKWANSHSNSATISTSNVSKTPTFYFPSIKNKPRSSMSPSLLLRPSTHKSPAQSIICKIPAKTSGDRSHDDIPKTMNSLVASCIAETEQELGLKMACSEVCVFYYSNISGFEAVKVEMRSRDDLQRGVKVNGLIMSICSRKWDELSLENICFNGGKKPVYESCWINSSDSDEGFVMIVPSDGDDEAMKIVVAHN